MCKIKLTKTIFKYYKLQPNEIKLWNFVGFENINFKKVQLKYYHLVQLH